MDLIGGYLLVIMILFSGNLSLLIGNYSMNRIKLIIISLTLFIISIGVLYASKYLNIVLIDYLTYLFLVVGVLLLSITVFYSKKDNYEMSLLIVFILFLISVLLISSQSNFNILIYSLLFLIIFIVIYPLSKLLHYAKRDYHVIIREYMCLFSILMFIFALTYGSILSIDYSMFSSFLILTPTYQLIYVIIGIIIILVAGVIINDAGGGK